MADIAQVEQLIRTALPGADVRVEDMAGGDHLYAQVRAPQFSGLSLLEQHRLVNQAVDHLLGPGRPIHALKIKTEVNGMIVTEDEIRQEILDSIQQNRVMLFMKGTPEMPRCGFSMQTVACLKRPARSSRPWTSCPTRASARCCRSTPAGRRSRSCSSTASWSAAATSSPSCTRAGKLKEMVNAAA